MLKFFKSLEENNKDDFTENRIGFFKAKCKQFKKLKWLILFYNHYLTQLNQLIDTESTYNMREKIKWKIKLLECWISNFEKLNKFIKKQEILDLLGKVNSLLGFQFSENANVDPKTQLKYKKYRLKYKILKNDFCIKQSNLKDLDIKPEEFIIGEKWYKVEFCQHLM